MTNEEAISHLRGYLDTEIYTDRCAEAHQIAVEAIEKQTPRKIDNKDEADLVYGCHCCGEINALWKMNGDKNNYCGNCGQKIDWSEEEWRRKSKK